MRMSRAAAPLLALGMVSRPAPRPPRAGRPAAAHRRRRPRLRRAPSAAAAGGVTVDLADSTLGEVLADGAGKPLYVFAPDAAASGKSVCNGDCATNWPPLTWTLRRPSARLDAEDFTLIARDDGTQQVAFYGHPVYFFKGDTAPNQTNGQGVGGKWSVVGADGNAIGAAASPAASEAASAAAGGAKVDLADNALGKILVGGDKGLTLYVFAADSGGKSACTGDCLANWPPLTSDAAPTLGTGLDAEDFATITRDDNGAKQVTFYGQPVYYFAGDTAAGDTKGQGLGGKWYVLDAEGKMIK